MEMDVTVDRRIEQSSGLDADRSHDQITVELEGMNAKAVLQLKSDSARAFTTGRKFALVLVAKD